MSVAYSRVFLALALVLFVLAALSSGGVIGFPDPGWLVPGGLAAWVLTGLAAPRQGEEPVVAPITGA